MECCLIIVKNFKLIEKMAFRTAYEKKISNTVCLIAICICCSLQGKANIERTITGSDIDSLTQSATLKRVCKMNCVKGCFPAPRGWETPLDTVHFTLSLKIIFDTDMHTDCDDAGALAVLHALADRGECEILAAMCSTKDPQAAAAIDAINTYYGRPDIPIGIILNRHGVKMASKYTERLAVDFPNDFDERMAKDAVELYRSVLERQPDSSVVIVTVGYLTNIKDLLQLPARPGQLSGVDLVKRKVIKWVCMGGNFIGRPAVDDLALGNENFIRDPVSTYYAIHNWPSKLVFVGREVCSVPSGLEVGEKLNSTPLNNPVRKAYELWFNGKAGNRHVADLVSVLYAVRGLRDYWDIEENGYMYILPDMTFKWDFAINKNQSYLLKRRIDDVPNDRYIEQVLEELLIANPAIKH